MVQAACPVMLFHVPRPQGVSTVDPFVSTKCPTLAFMQLDWPAWSCQVPMEHGVGDDAPGSEKLPAGTLPQSAEELEPVSYTHLTLPTKA